MRFKEIVGQRDIINRLTEIIDQGRVSHAQLILGDERDGSLAIALAYLQYLSCEHREHYSDGDLRADSCGECPSCKKISQLTHPDLHLVFPNATTERVKSNPESQLFIGEFIDFVKQTRGCGTTDEWYHTMGIENKQAEINVRDANAIVESLRLKSYEGGWKMMVVWMADKMTTAAANKLLKTIEEPTAQTLLLLVAKSEERILPTIISRVQRVQLESIAPSLRSDATEKYALLMVEWLRMLFKLKMRELATQVEKMTALNREDLKLFLQYSLDTMRNCFLNTAAGVECSIGSGDAKFDSQFPKMITTNNIQLIDEALNEAIFSVGRNANAKITLMELSFKMSKALKKR